jgi:hypothetical protein
MHATNPPSSDDLALSFFHLHPSPIHQSASLIADILIPTYYVLHLDALCAPTRVLTCSGAVLRKDADFRCDWSTQQATHLVSSRGKRMMSVRISFRSRFPFNGLPASTSCKVKPRFSFPFRFSSINCCPVDRQPFITPFNNMSSKTALVMRATGRQGMGVIHHLSKAGWRIHALVADASSDRALALKSFSSQITLYQGTWRDPPTIEAAI